MLEDMSKDLQVAEDEALGMAGFYIDKGENEQAVQILEELTNSKIQTPYKYLILAGVYQRNQSYELAEDKCNRALELAIAAGDFEAQVAAKAGLAQIKKLLNNQKEAQSYLKAAEEEYNVLEKELKERLSRLRSTIGEEQQLLYSVLGDCTCNGQPRKRWAGRCVPCMGGE